jgi:type IV pilus assembly protein PilA
MFQCRSKQSEAKGNLKALGHGEQAYFAEKGEYSRDLATIGFQPMGAKQRYQYVVMKADKDSFVAEARGVSDGVAGDVWTIDKTLEPQNVTNICRH